MTPLLYRGYDRRRLRRRKSSTLRGLLVEPAATNLIPDNVNLALGGWQLPSMTKTTGQSLRSSTYGVRMLCNAPNATFKVSNAAALPGTDMCLSWYWRAGTANGATVSSRDATDVTTLLFGNWSETAPGTLNFTMTTGSGKGYVYLGNGWYRLWLYSTLYVAANGYTVTFQGGASGTYDDFALIQFESGRNPTSPLPNTTAGTVSRAADTFSSVVGAGLWAASAGTYVEDSLWLQSVSQGNNYAPLTALGGAAAGAADTQVGTRNTGALTSQCLGTVLGDVPGQFSLVARVRTAKTVLLGGGNHRAVVGATLVGTSANASVNGNTALDRVRDPGFVSLTSGIIYQLATYNVDLGNAAAQAIDASGFALSAANRTLLMDFRAGAMPGGSTFGRTSTALNDDFTVAAAGAPRFVAGPF